LHFGRIELSVARFSRDAAVSVAMARTPLLSAPCSTGTIKPFGVSAAKPIL